MKSYQAMKSCIGDKCTIEVAKALRKSTSLINKWQEPATDFTDSGTLNPLDRLETIIRTCLGEGQSKDNAYAPILYLAQRFGLTVIPLPESKPTLADVFRECHESITDFGQFIAAFSDASADGHISPLEHRHIELKGLQTIQHIIAVIQKSGEGL